MRKENKNYHFEEKVTTALRCYTCNHEYRKLLNNTDRMSDEKCPECNKQTVEINFGKVRQ